MLVFDGGDGRQLWQRWMIETASAFDGVRWRRVGLRREDKRVTQGQAMQQPASTMRGGEGDAT